MAPYRLPDEHARDARDLSILQMLDDGATQQQAADAAGVTRGLITRLLSDIKEDDKCNS